MKGQVRHNDAKRPVSVLFLVAFIAIFAANAVLPSYCNEDGGFISELLENAEGEAEEEQKERVEIEKEEAIVHGPTPYPYVWTSAPMHQSNHRECLQRECAEVVTPPPEV